jgi:hypothetical protein
MKILEINTKNGRTYYHGSGTYEEVKSLNIKSTFDDALDGLVHLRKIYNYNLGKGAGYKVKRNIYGRRKAD